MSTRSILAVAILAVTAASGKLWANELFVGDPCPPVPGAEPGTRGNPHNSLQLAYDLASPGEGDGDGDVVVVLPNSGSPPYPRLTVEKSGLRFRAESGPLETFCEGFQVQSNIKVRITGFTISSSTGSGVDVAAECKLVTIENCSIHSCTGNGIRVVESATSIRDRLLVVNSVIHKNAQDGIRLEGTRFDSSGLYAPKAHVLNCAITGNGGWGLGIRTSEGLERCPYTASAPVEVRWSFVASSSHLEPIKNGSGAVGCVDVSAPCDPQGRVTVCDPITSIPDYTNEGAGDLRIENYGNNGAPGKRWLNPDGTRNTVGFLGGPQSVGFFETPTERSPKVQAVVIERVPGDENQVRICVTVK